MENEKNQALVIALRESEYRRLSAVAAKACRDPEDQAHWYVRRAINRLPKTKEAVFT